MKADVDTKMAACRRTRIHLATLHAIATSVKVTNGRHQAVDTLVRFLEHDPGHHRLVIDPAADNEPAVRCHTGVGFRPVGIMRRYERDADGVGWHDGLLTDLLVESSACRRVTVPAVRQSSPCR